MASKTLPLNLEIPGINNNSNLANISSFEDLRKSLKELKRLSLRFLQESRVKFSNTQFLLQCLFILTKQFSELLAIGASNEDSTIPSLIIELSHIVGKCSEKRMFRGEDDYLIDIKEIDHLHSEYLLLLDIGNLIPKIGFASIEPVG